MTYDFKILPELVWAIVVCVVGVLAATVATQGVVGPDDWQAWLIGLGAALARALPAAILGIFNKNKPTDTEPALEDSV